ncbi:MAG: hypothetical protein ABIV50_14170, partial [Opitutus sp.]
MAVLQLSSQPEAVNAPLRHFGYRLGKHGLERFNLNWSRTPPHCHREVREARRGDPAGMLRR